MIDELEGIFQPPAFGNGVKCGFDGVNTDFDKPLQRHGDAVATFHDGNRGRIAAAFFQHFKTLLRPTALGHATHRNSHPLGAFRQAIRDGPHIERDRAGARLNRDGGRCTGQLSCMPPPVQLYRDGILATGHCDRIAMAIHQFHGIPRLGGGAFLHRIAVDMNPHIDGIAGIRVAFVGHGDRSLVMPLRLAVFPDFQPFEAVIGPRRHGQRQILARLRIKVVFGCQGHRPATLIRRDG